MPDIMQSIHADPARRLNHSKISSTTVLEEYCTNVELDYTEQTSQLLSFPENTSTAWRTGSATEAALDGKKYTHILIPPYRWEAGRRQGRERQADHNKALTGDDLTGFVDAAVP